MYDSCKSFYLSALMMLDFVLCDVDAKIKVNSTGFLEYKFS